MWVLPKEYGKRRACILEMENGWYTCHGVVIFYFRYHEVGLTTILNGLVDENIYWNVMEDFIRPYVSIKQCDNWTFQRDNEPIQTAQIVKHYFSDDNISVVDGPSINPDLNRIEYLWYIINWDLYTNVRQNLAVEELK